MGLLDTFRGLIKRKTPIPLDKDIYNMGIQERSHPTYMAGPLLYSMATSSVITRTCTTQLKNEIFRRGYIWEKKFSVKCVDCGEEYQKEIDQCSMCNSHNLRKPDRRQKIYATNFFEGYINSGLQLFVDVLKEMEDDLNIVDDSYLVFIKEYYLDGQGDIVMWKVKEILRADPITMFIETDEYGERGVTRWTCVSCRDFITEDPEERCDQCGGKAYPVHYINRVHGEDQLYLENEVMHFSKYSPTRLYGSPPILTLWNHVTTLLAMESYINTSYSKSRTPRGVLAVQTNNMESLIRYWKGVKEKLEKDPHYIPIMGIETEGNTRGSVEWVPFMNTLKEMDYINVKDDLRDRIAAFYGVSKIFMSDTSTSGGLNNEGMQILVTNRAVEMGQSVYDKYVFPFITTQFGITDWIIVLPRSEEEDELSNLRRREIEVALAGQIKNLGFDVDMDEDGNFIYKKDLLEETQPKVKEGKVEKDPYAGTNVDASQLGQMMAGEGADSGGGGEGGGKLSTGPPKRHTGSPPGVGNNNVDRRSEGRVPK